MAKIPWFKCYASDLLGALAEMTPHEAALYTVCLLRMYDEDRPIPDEIERLARRCNMRISDCRKAMDGLERQGRLVRREGIIINPRAAKELSERTAYSKEQSTKARKKPIKTTSGVNNGTAVDQPIPEARSQNISSSEDIYAPPPKKRPRGKPKTTAPPADFEVTDATRRRFHERNLGDEAIERQLAYLADKAAANGYAYKDWNAALRNCLDWSDSPASCGNGRGRADSDIAAIHRAVARAEQGSS